MGQPLRDQIHFAQLERYKAQQYFVPLVCFVFLPVSCLHCGLIGGKLRLQLVHVVDQPVCQQPYLATYHVKRNLLPKLIYPSTLHGLENNRVLSKIHILVKKKDTKFLFMAMKKEYIKLQTLLRLSCHKSVSVCARSTCVSINALLREIAHIPMSKLVSSGEGNELSQS